MDKIETYVKQLSDAELIAIVQSYNEWFECANRRMELDRNAAIRVHARQLVILHDRPADYEIAFMKDLASTVCRILATRWVHEHTSV